MDRLTVAGRERGGTERCRRREEQVMSSRDRKDWKRKCVWRRVRTVSEGESPCQRGWKRQIANTVDSFLSCVGFFFFFFVMSACARLCSCTHLQRRACTDSYGINPQPAAHIHTAIRKGTTTASQDITASFHIPEIGWIKVLLTRQGVGLSKELHSSWGEQVAHLVSKEVFLNLKPEGSTIPLTVPGYIVAAFICLQYPVHWRYTVANWWCIVLPGGPPRFLGVGPG